MKMEKLEMIIIQCCECRAFKIGEEPNEYIKVKPEVDRYFSETLLISHGYCPPCYEIKKQEIRALKASNYVKD